MMGLDLERLFKQHQKVDKAQLVAISSPLTYYST